VLLKALFGPLVAFLGGLGVLRVSVVMENYMLLAAGMFLALAGLLMLFTPSRDRAPRTHRFREA